MKTTEIKAIRLEADKGKILTDGKTYGSVVFLGSEKKANEFYEIPKEEYDRIMAEQEEEVAP